MLEELRLGDFGAISGELLFSSGFNVIVGETGTGKSLLLSSILFLKGEKSQVVKEGSFVEAHFALNGQELSLRREIKGGRSRYFLNGMRVPAAKVKEELERLVLFQSQRLASELLRPSYQLKVLDAVSQAQELLSRYRELFKRYSSLLKEREELLRQMAERERELDLLKYQINEIEEELPLLEREEELLELKELVSKAEEVGRVRESLLSDLYSGSPSALDLVGRASSRLEALGLYPELTKKLTDLYYELEAVCSEIERTLVPPETDFTLEEIEEKLYRIEKLKRKYGYTVKEVKSFLKRAKERLSLLENAEFELESFQEEVERTYRQLLSVGRELSEKRKGGKELLKDKVLSSFKELGLSQARFEPKLVELESPSYNGLERVEFLFSGNPKLPLAPLSDSISGGELSRLLLTLLSILSLGNVTVVFDEIDAGTSGKILRKVAEKLKEIAKRQQVIAVSHSPQVVAAADKVFKLEKLESEEVAVRELSREELLLELAVMISGEQSRASLEAARDLLKSWEE